MSDGGTTTQEIAWRLFNAIAAAEKKNLHGVSVNTDRAWIIKTFEQCRMAASGENTASYILQIPQ